MNDAVQDYYYFFLSDFIQLMYVTRHSQQFMFCWHTLFNWFWHVRLLFLHLFLLSKWIVFGLFLILCLTQIVTIQSTNRSKVCIQFQIHLALVPPHPLILELWIAFIFSSFIFSLWWEKDDNRLFNGRFMKEFRTRRLIGLLRIE